MNYLAHLYLADDSPESLLGNLIGDFLKGTTVDSYSESIKNGIKLHKQVDRYTDLHDIVKKSKQLISPVNKRYAGIIVDVFYDHFLAKNWSNYSSVPLNSFTSNVYHVLQENYEILPDSLKRVAPTMIAENRLMSYVKISGMSTALKRISERLKRENSLENAVEDLKANYE
ncbi:MAG: DUF479 domain-containing protein, partial [Nostoc sp. C3-bin3]|nr:DUF479 domain-containing protein [Nostoc sp. C3-bin3]